MHRELTWCLIAWLIICLLFKQPNKHSLQLAPLLFKHAPQRHQTVTPATCKALLPPRQKLSSIILWCLWLALATTFILTSPKQCAQAQLLLTVMSLSLHLPQLKCTLRLLGSLTGMQSPSMMGATRSQSPAPWPPRTSDSLRISSQ
jgi:hypothetical protein